MRLFLGYIFIFFPFITLGQSVLKATNYLRLTFEAQQLSEYNQKGEFLFNGSFELPLFDKIEIRTETNDFRPEQQEYLLRMSPNSLKSRKLQRQIHDFNTRLNEVEYEAEVNDLLFKRYQNILVLFMIQRKIDLGEQLKVVYEDKLRVIDRLTNTEGFDLLEQIETEQAHFEAVYEIEKFQHEQKILLEHISREIGTNQITSLDTTNFISIDEVEEVLKELSPENIAYLPVLEEKRLEIQLLNHEFDFERAKRQQLLDFFQVQYGFQNNDRFREELSLGLSIRLPVKGSSKLKMNKIQLEMIEAEQDEHITYLEVNEEVKVVSDRVNLLFKQRRRLLEQLTQSEERLRKGQYQRLVTENPLALLKVQRGKLSLKSTLNDIEHNIYTEYINLLNLSGKLVEKPTRNYLSSSLEVIKR